MDNQHNEFTFICIRCGKELAYRLLSDDNETCINCVETIKANVVQQKKYLFEQTKKQEEKDYIRKVNMSLLLKSILRGVKGMAFIDLGNNIIHIDNVISITKEESYSFEKREEKMFNIKLHTREDKEYYVGEYNENDCKHKMNEIRKIIKKNQKIYSL